MSATEEVDRIPVWLDCDPGHDDALAILLASYSPKINLLGVSIVHGNHTVEHCSKNAIRILWACGVRGVHVFKGLDRPLLREPKYCPEIHGTSGEDGVAGMCGYHFPDDKVFHEHDYWPQSEHGINAMADTILSHPRKVTVVLTGAQTNMAFALRMYPQITKKIEKIVFMGGAIGLGNTGVAAEFNIQIDPEAASIVFHSGLPLVMIPLEVTHQVLATPSILSKVANIDNETLRPLTTPEDYTFTPETLPHRHVEYKEIKEGIERRKRLDAPSEGESKSDAVEFSSPFAECFYKLLTFFKHSYKNHFGFSSPPLHDCNCIFFLTNPESFSTIPVYVDVELASEKCQGRTLCDLNGLLGKEKNMLVCTDVDVERFWTNMLWCMKTASSNSPLNDDDE